ncbi:conserved hypothetical protein [Talaromyces stipitatus ATCC 10500]|uniref:Transcription factor domain-containing protein n=1 Tax=Talaromyces stipitatus (strain ATCC 10500 / CBS 375.48 / QM 6759 / NRRL 1006) TaxID=441959 RepID=B8M7R1_TALSN|nr:uncharacterized protein TSTA_030560 [Talaromyces stipitatus ATCC 10500]EED19790.1 conserved hypothetical protein [Talaromyces stipitatus ATCC 10500]
MEDASCPFVHHAGNNFPEKASSFLFVNKNALSGKLTRSDTIDEKVNILSHVQQRRRQRAEKVIKSTLGWEKSGLSVIATSKEQTASKSNAQHVPTVQKSTKDLLRIYPMDNATDPFHSTIVGTEAQMWTKIPTRCASILKTVNHGREASRIHLQAMIELVKSIGGWHKIDAYVLESMILVDKFSAMIDMTHPILPMTWVPEPLIQYNPEYQHSETADNLRRLGGNFVPMTVYYELAKTLQDIADFCRIAQWIWSRQDVSSKDESDMFLHLQSLNYRLLLLDKLSSTENCIRLAALVFLQNIIHYQGAQLSAILVIRHLKNALSEVSPHIQHSWDDECMLWILCTGAMATEATDEREWFLARTAYMSKNLSVDLGGLAFRELLEGYLFIWEKQDYQLSAMLENLCFAMDDA